VIASTSTSKKEIDNILKQHTSCFSFDYCNQCKVQIEISLGWNLDDLLHELARNPNLNQNQQKAVLALTDDYQSLWEVFVSNPNISDGTKSGITSGGEFWRDMDEDRVTQIIEAMEANPRFTDRDIEEFRAYFEDDWGYGQESNSDD
jgi:hypothetical protein